MVNITRALAERGISVDLVLASAVGPYLGEVSGAVRVVDLGASGTVQSLPALVRYLRARRPSVLLATLNRANVVAILARELARVRTRLFVREANTLSQVDAPTIRDRILPVLVKRLYRRADGVVAVSQGVADDLVRLKVVRGDRIHVLPNPVVTPELETLAAAELDLPWFRPGGPPVVLGVGRFSTQKDFATLVRAFELVRRRRVARLVLLGEGEQRSQLEALARSGGIEPDVFFAGFVANPFQYMSRAAVTALSSRWEGLPGVLIQAMACGCPVVSTDCPSGPREILEGGRFGRLVPIGEPAQLADAILATFDEPRRSSELRARAAHFSMDRSADAYVDVLLGGSHSPLPILP